MRRSFSRFIASVAVVTLAVSACTSDDDDGGAEPSLPGATEAPGDTSDDAIAADDTAADTTTGDTEGTTADTAEEVQTGESILDTVIANDVVRCGSNNAVPGFGVVDAAGEHVGFDADFCRVIAAAVLGDATKVEFVDLAAADRFTALQSGEIDVLVRNTTWTATRDGGESATFLQPNFYDGQGMMVAADSGFASISDMDNVIVCVTQGTTTEGNAAAEAARLGLTWEVRPFADPPAIQAAFEAGQCDGWSSDTSQLTGLRSTYPAGPEALTILPEVFSKEPLAPAVVDGDSRWAQAVEWAIFATIQAEEFGITSDNIASFDAGTDPNLQRFLGLEAETEDGAAVLDPGLGLPTDYAVQVVTQVGNYAEIFDANLAPLGLERGVNALWTDGGLMYAPPYR
jgi:general L-amino acid transport system substrate-binding protein